MYFFDPKTLKTQEHPLVEWQGYRDQIRESQTSENRYTQWPADCVRVTLCHLHHLAPLDDEDDQNTPLEVCPVCSVSAEPAHLVTISSGSSGSSGYSGYSGL